ncbi:ammonium transporter [Candidatus Ruthia magnifica str. Cm (Calyptogena magnifica)]|uniref:Ammonium transporter n=1 Tax=Ruthia magnifica subsp. Calyptogena magnifica TaxID=413404 RepID=A1AVV2_RUTMC|nr:ammonium transporter [Candidatus Ruthturnera calyptogenae]ABL02059.1 ammonium transporter [Candidatus Ruthia magnifica str. Cm (Calyptogena magnifica)]
MGVFAQDINGADTAWIMTSTALVLFMTLPGLALFYGGLVRTKNILSILMQCFAIAGIISILWFVVGYSIAFSGDNPYFGDFSNVLLVQISINTVNGSIPESLFAVFQMTFAIITPALIIGSYAERMKFSAVLLFSSIWLLVVYAPVTHWVWGGGWLGNVLDYAGGTVVHITAGIAALVAAIVLGPRKDFFKKPMPPHNMTMTITGAAMLWVGWFGFNGGSALVAGGDAAMAILVTHISAATGAITWMFYEWIKFGKPTALGTVTGMVAGLGTITSASGFVGPTGALVIGFISGIVCFNAVIIIKQKFKIDDSLDVFPVHGVGGIIGTLMTGFFASKELGIFSGQGGWDRKAIVIADQLQIQFIGVVATVIYTAVVTYLILKVVDAITGLRVSEEEEQQGLDIVSHEEKGYDL